MAVYKLKKILAKVNQYYKLDPRSLSLMRVAVGLIVLADLYIRASDLTAFYSNEGVWPLELMHNFGWHDGYWSIHGLFEKKWWPAALFVMHGMAALSLLVGYRTRLSSLITWLLYISLHNRNVFLQQGGDDLLRLILFWGIFLPWGNSYSLDRKAGRISFKTQPLAELGYLLLIASVYLFTVLLKSGPEWRENFNAVYYALSLEQLRLPPIGDWIYTSPLLMKALTVFTLLLETAIPVLILIPLPSGKTRNMAFLCLLILHIGIGSTLFVGLFFIINVITGLGLLSTSLLNSLERKIKILRVSSDLQKLKSTPRCLVWLGNLICAIVICVSVFINLSGLKQFNYELDDVTRIPVNTLRLDQYWGMFSPNILKTEGWYVYYGLDSLGRQWDIRTNSDFVDFNKPGRLLSMHGSDRWRKLTENMQRDNMTFLRPLYCKYKLRTWNQMHPEKKLHSITLFYMQSSTLENYQRTKPEKKLYCVCNDN